ncbi:hypothetical protein D3C87_119400 [compost metagenome]
MKYSDNKGNSVAEKGLADPVKEYIRLWERRGNRQNSLQSMSSWLPQMRVMLMGKSMGIFL